MSSHASDFSRLSGLDEKCLWGIVTTGELIAHNESTPAKDEAVIGKIVDAMTAIDRANDIVELTCKVQRCKAVCNLILSTPTARGTFIIQEPNNLGDCVMPPGLPDQEV